MFAFAIWDSKNSSCCWRVTVLVLNRLYFSQTAQRLLFASNTQALIHADDNIDTSIDSTALHHLFTLHAVVPAPRTVVNGIRKVKPAHYMLIDNSGNVQEKRYWSLTAKRPDRDNRAGLDNSGT